MKPAPAVFNNFKHIVGGLAPGDMVQVPAGDVPVSQNHEDNPQNIIQAAAKQQPVQQFFPARRRDIGVVSKRNMFHGGTPLRNILSAGKNTITEKTIAPEPPAMLFSAARK
jgi:hypothetical protein